MSQLKKKKSGFRISAGALNACKDLDAQLPHLVGLQGSEGPTRLACHQAKRRSLLRAHTSAAARAPRRAPQVLLAWKALPAGEEARESPHCPWGLACHLAFHLLVALRAPQMLRTTLPGHLSVGLAGQPCVGGPGDLSHSRPLLPAPCRRGPRGSSSSLCPSPAPQGASQAMSSSGPPAASEGPVP